MKMVTRDIALEDYKKDKNQENLRYYKNLKNEINKQIGQERYIRKSNKFNDEKTTPKEKWNNVKKETGQNKFENPELILEGGNHHTHPKKIAKALNRQYLQKKLKKL